LHLVVVAFYGTIIVVSVPRLLKIILNLCQTRLQLLLLVDEDLPILRFALLQMLGGISRHGGRSNFDARRSNLHFVGRH
jgi:hypothetical protein